MPPGRTPKNANDIRILELNYQKLLLQRQTNLEEKKLDPDTNLLPRIVPKPPGPYNLKEVLGVKARPTSYNMLRKRARALMEGCDRHQTFHKLDQRMLFAKATKLETEFPYLQGFINSWAAMEILQSVFKNAKEGDKDKQSALEAENVELEHHDNGVTSNTSTKAAEPRRLKRQKKQDSFIIYSSEEGSGPSEQGSEPEDDSEVLPLSSKKSTIVHPSQPARQDQSQPASQSTHTSQPSRPPQSTRLPPTKPKAIRRITSLSDNDEPKELKPILNYPVSKPTQNTTRAALTPIKSDMTKVDGSSTTTQNKQSQQPMTVKLTKPTKSKTNDHRTQALRHLTVKQEYDDAVSMRDHDYQLFCCPDEGCHDDFPDNPSAELVSLVTEWRNTRINTLECDRLLLKVCHKVREEVTSCKTLEDTAKHYRWPTTKLDAINLRKRILSHEEELKHRIENNPDARGHVIFKELKKIASSMGLQGIPGLARINLLRSYVVTDYLRPGYFGIRGKAVIMNTCAAMFGGVELPLIPAKDKTPFSAPYFTEFVLVPLVTVILIREDNHGIDDEVAFRIMVRSAEVGEYFQEQDDDKEMGKVQRLNHELLLSRSPEEPPSPVDDQALAAAELLASLGTRCPQVMKRKLSPVPELNENEPNLKRPKPKPTSSTRPPKPSTPESKASRKPNSSPSSDPPTSQTLKSEPLALLTSSPKINTRPSTPKLPAASATADSPLSAAPDSPSPRKKARRRRAQNSAPRTRTQPQRKKEQN